MNHLKRWIWRLVILSIVALCAYFALGFVQQKWLVSRFNRFFDLDLELSRRAAALEVSRKALSLMDQANLYAFLKPENATQLADELQRLALVTTPKGLRDLKLSYRDLVFKDGSISVNIDFETTLNNVPASATGIIIIEAGTALNGASIDLIPIDTGIRFTSVKVFGKTDKDVLPRIFNGALAPVTDYLFSRISSINIPLDLGLLKEIDLRKEILSMPIINSVDAPPPFKAILVFEEGAVIPLQDGLHILANARLVPPEEFDAAVDGLKGLKAQLQGVLLPTCRECKFDVLQTEKYWQCLKNYIQCRKQEVLRVGPGLQLTPIQMLAQRELRGKTDPESKALYEALKNLEVPWTGVDPTLPANETGLDATLKSCKSLLSRVRATVDADIPIEKGSLLALRKDFISKSVNQVLKLRNARATIKMNDRQEPFNHTLKTDPAADLKCGENLPACESVFSFRPYNPRGCDSNCSTRNCHNVPLIGEVCVNGTDLGCLARKGKCEAEKEAERLAYEAEKGKAQAEWTVKKLACETNKEMIKKGCEINQAWLNATQNTELARVEGTATITNTSGGILVKESGISDDLKSITADVQIAGGTKVSVSYVLTPLNIGHLACQWPSGGDVEADLNLEPRNLQIKASLADSDSDVPELSYAVDSLDLAIKMSPPPAIALLGRNPQLVLSCAPVAGVLEGFTSIAGIAGRALQVKFLLTDTFNFKTPATKFTIPVVMKTVTLPFPGFKIVKKVSGSSVILLIIPS